MTIKPKHIGYGIAAVIIVGILALGYYYYRNYKKALAYCYLVMGAVVHELSLQRISFTLMLKVKNKSDYSAKISNQRYDVYVNDMLISKITNPGTQIINARGYSTFKIDIEFKPADLLKAGVHNIGEILYDKSKLLIDVRGLVTLESGMVKINDYKLDIRYTLAELLEPTPDMGEC